MLISLRAIGTLSLYHSLNRRRQEQNLATKVSGQEIKTKKGGNNARTGIATGLGTRTMRVGKRVPKSKSYSAEGSIDNRFQFKIWYCQSRLVGRPQRSRWDVEMQYVG